MLVLTRQPHEAVLIQRDIRIEVLSVHGNRVKLGITAPGSMRIVREELLSVSREPVHLDNHESGGWLHTVRGWLFCRSRHHAS